MKILYGVVGEGMGHATRSRVVLDHLRARGHEIRIVASHGAAALLARHFGAVLPIEGMRMIFDEQSRVRRTTTFLSLLGRGIVGLPRNVAAYFELIHEDFQPDVVISDFESWTHLYAMLHGVPIISLDNIQIVSRCKLPDDLVRARRWDYRLNKLLTQSKLPYCDRYLLTSFFRPPVAAPRTSIHPPVLRPEILEARPTRGDHLLVYQSAGRHDALRDALAKTGLECRVYGMERGLSSDGYEGNLRHRPFDEATFIEDLASARGVIATGGATLMSECVHLGKPMLALPIAGQFEQAMNSTYLDRAGYGRMSEHVDLDVVRGFLSDLPRFEDALAGYERDGNRELLLALERSLHELVGEVEPVTGGESWASVA